MSEAEPESRDGAGPRLEITYFTDPLCCWSWGYEPQIRRLRYGFAGRIGWRLRVGVLIRDWKTFRDPINDVHRPVQMGPVWIHCGVVTGMPVQPTIWVHDPPHSSWPACLAVRTAGLQSPSAADLYLRRLRESVMAEGQNIGRDDVLVAIARSLAAERPEVLDFHRFARDFESRAARAALDDDVRETRYLGVNRFPCLALRRSGAAPVWLAGWRPWHVLIASVRTYVPDLGPERRPPSNEGYTRYWSGAREQELAVAVERSAASAAVTPVAGATDVMMSSGSV